MQYYTVWNDTKIRPYHWIFGQNNSVLESLDFVTVIPIEKHYERLPLTFWTWLLYCARLTLPEEEMKLEDFPEQYIVIHCIISDVSDKDGGSNKTENDRIVLYTK